MKLHFKIKTREQFVDMLKLLYVKFPLVLLGIALVAIVVGFFGTKIWGNENGLSQAMGILFVATLNYPSRDCCRWVLARYEARHRCRGRATPIQNRRAKVLVLQKPFEKLSVSYAI